MLKLILCLSLLSVVLVTAHGGRGGGGGCKERHSRHRGGGGGGFSSGRRTCRKLLRGSGGRQERNEIANKCADELNITLPEPSRHHRYGKRHADRGRYSDVPEEFSDCMDDEIFSSLGAQDEAGNVDAEALADAIEDTINTNTENNPRVSITPDQITAIKSKVPECLDEASSQSPMYKAFKRCLKDACQTIISG